MLVKVRVTILRSSVPFKVKTTEGFMTAIPQIGKRFRISFNPKQGATPSLKVLESSVVTRILVVFPDQVWIDTELTLFKLEIIHENQRFAKSFISWISFLKK